MPSFDIVSEINHQELDNALNQARKEIETRYDFRGTKTEITLDKELIKILSDDEFRMKAVHDILQSKILKRGIDLKALEIGKIEDGPSGLVKCEVKIIEGIEQEIAKKIIREIKDSKIKVQAQIQEEQVRVTGKNRDDLQEAMALARRGDFGIPLQFKNFRD